MGDLKKYRVIEPKKFSLRQFDPAAQPASSGDAKDDAERMASFSKSISNLQNAMYAEGKRKVLVVLQGMDTSGKDGTTNGVFGDSHPLGVRAVAFKAPTSDELAHDFLWRVHPHVPPKGCIAIFNRSHYEDVVAALVTGAIDRATCEQRYRHIVEFERMLVESGTVILKFFLHISKDEQKVRLQERLSNPEKYWKFNPGDLTERARWDTNLETYAQAIAATGTKLAPWWIIPANAKPQRNLMVATIVHEALVKIAPDYPPLNPDYKKLKVK